MRILRSDGLGAGRIEDKDGFTNVRSAPGKDSEVVGRVLEGDAFVVLSQTGEWWRILTRYGVEGSLHKSRIRELRI